MTAASSANESFETPLSEYPPSDYRRLVAAAAQCFGVGTDEIMVGAGADEVLDIVGKVFIPEGSRAVAARCTTSGAIFVGAYSSEAAGDYLAGGNHVLPTGGLARSSGALAVESFGKFLQVQRITREGLAGIAETVTALAEAEGLLAHRDAVLERFRDARP